MGNSALRRADGAKRDEFYTRLEDIEKELDNYREHFEGKVIYLNCDDPKFSAFWKYFSSNFDYFGIKKLIATYYEPNGSHSYKYECERNNDTDKLEVIKTKLKGDGDFRSEECIKLLKEADVVATNPPFSLFREYMTQLVDYDKKFVIIGNMNAFTYQEIFPLLKDNIIWTGHEFGKMSFRIPDHYPSKSDTYVGEDGHRYQKLGNVCWFTNLEIDNRHKEMVLTEFYEGNEDHYPKYDNYSAIEVSRTKDIPMDYEGVMGVPITFMDKYGPDQFEILGMAKTPNCHDNNTEAKRTKIYENVTKYNKDGTTANGSYLNNAPVLEISEPLKNKTYYKVDGKLYRAVYARILIVNKKPKVQE